MKCSVTYSKRDGRITLQAAGSYIQELTPELRLLAVAILGLLIQSDNSGPRHFVSRQNSL